MIESIATNGHTAPTRRLARLNGGFVLVAAAFEVQHYLETALTSQGFTVRLADSPDEMCRSLRGHPDVALILVDQDLLRDALRNTLREARKLSPEAPIVILSSGGSAPDLPPELHQRTDVVVAKQPVFHSDLQSVIAGLLNGKRSPREPLGTSKPFLMFSAESPNLSVQRIAKLIGQAALCDVPVLVQGETGVGKETLVRAIHGRSSRAGRPFVSVNCAALPRELVESQLFGYERGAFTGAYRNQPGLFELADGGTIFLDEIGDMDIRLQAKLLQVLQDQEFHPLGSSTSIRVDVRVMAATHRNLEAAIAAGKLRADLYYRLNVVSITIPPLRERKSEILSLAAFLLARHTPDQTRVPELDSDVKRLLLIYDWPGNVRELENLMRRYLVLRDASVFRELRGTEVQLTPVELGVQTQVAGTSPRRSIFESLDQARNQAQIDALVGALTAAHWNRKKAADILRVDYKSLLYQMKKFQIGESGRRSRSKSPSNANDSIPPGTAAMALG